MLRYVLLFLGLASPARAQPSADMPGWKSSLTRDGVEWTPAGLSAGRSFTYTLFFSLPAKGVLSADLKTFADGDVVRWGVVSQPLSLGKSETVLTFSGAVRDRGKSRIVTYLAFRSGRENRFARVLSEPDEKLYLPYLAEVGRHFGRLTRTSLPQVYIPK